MEKLVYLSLGSNMGDRRRNLERAVELLGPGGVAVLRRSSFYETEPRDLVHQPFFLNLVVEAETQLFPRRLLRVLQRIESQLGRRRTVDKGPRTLDIDIIFFGTLVMTTKELVIPHPRMRERRFVLEPLAELSPDWRDPVTHHTVRQLSARVTSQKVTKLK